LIKETKPYENDNKITIPNWLWAKKNAMEVIRDVDQKFVETDYIIDTFNPDVSVNLKFGKNLNTFFLFGSSRKKYVIN
jgi:hypothetical protein